MVATLTLAGCGGEHSAGRAPAPPAAGPAPAADVPDLERGRLLALACAACHTFGPGERHLLGPNLHGVFGRPAASLEGFQYSPALAATGIVWTPELLDRWLAEPADFVPGTTMAFTGYRRPDDRRDLIAYLVTATGGE